MRTEIKRNDNKIIITEIITFLLLFIFQIALNIFEVVPRSLPDEIGAMAAAVKLSGNDWSYVLAQSGKYYGFGTAVFMFPVFMLFKNPLVIYQIILGWGAFLRTVPVLFCFDIAKRIKIQNRLTVILISVISVIGTPTRSTNIDNEPMLILLAWAIFYLLILLQDAGKKRRTVYSGVLGLVLAYSLTVHTRAYLLILGTAIAVILYLIIYRKSLINYLSFVPVCGFGSAIAFILQNIVKQKVYTCAEYTEVVLDNTLSSASGGIAQTLSDTLFTGEGIRAFITVICSNLWIIFVFYAGIIVITVARIISWVIKRIIPKAFINPDNESDKGSTDVLMISAMFAITVFLVSLAALGIVWLGSAIEVWDYRKEMARGFFYLRYVGNTFGPVLFTGCIYLYFSKIKGRYFAIPVVSLILIVKYMISSVISVAISNGHLHGDWFGYFSPLAFSDSRWNGNNQNILYYVIATAVSVALFGLIFSLNRKGKKNFALTVLAVLLVYEYAFSAITWDGSFSHSKNYYGIVNETVRLVNNTSFFEDTERVYYIDDVYGRQFVVQFVLFDKQLISDAPSKINDDTVILISDLNNLNKYRSVLPDQLYCIKLDEDEYVLTANPGRKEKLISYGYTETDLFDDSEKTDNGGEM